MPRKKHTRFRAHKEKCPKCWKLGPGFLKVSLGIDKFRSKAPPRSERFQRAIDAWEPTHLALLTELEVQLTKEEVEALISLSKRPKAPPVPSPELPNP